MINILEHKELVYELLLFDIIIVGLFIFSTPSVCM